MYEYDFNTYSIRRKKSRKKPIIFLIVFSVCIFFIFSMFNRNSSDNPRVASSAVSKTNESNTNFEDNPLGLVVKQSLLGTEGSYAVGIRHLKNNEAYFLNEHRVYESASLYKLWVMATAFEQIQEGRLKEDEVLENDIAVLNKKFDIASESAEFTEGKISLTVGSALKQMITISHNYAALLLTEKLRLSTVRQFLERNGLHESSVGISGQPPRTTAADTALFFEKLSKGKLANEVYTARMIELLEGQRLNNKLPKYLPEGTTIAHKTGELGFYTHDAGIVFSPGGDYIIVVLSKSTYPLGAEDRIGKISEAVYNYFLEKR